MVQSLIRDTENKHCKEREQGPQQEPWGPWTVGRSERNVLEVKLGGVYNGESTGAAQRGDLPLGSQRRGDAKCREGETVLGVMQAGLQTQSYLNAVQKWGKELKALPMGTVTLKENSTNHLSRSQVRGPTVGRGGGSRAHTSGICWDQAPSSVGLDSTGAQEAQPPPPQLTFYALEPQPRMATRAGLHEMLA